MAETPPFWRTSRARWARSRACSCPCCTARLSCRRSARSMRHHRRARRAVRRAWKSLVGAEFRLVAASRAARAAGSSPGRPAPPPAPRHKTRGASAPRGYAPCLPGSPPRGTGARCPVRRYVLVAHGLLDQRHWSSLGPPKGLTFLPLLPRKGRTLSALAKAWVRARDPSPGLVPRPPSPQGRGQGLSWARHRAR